MRECAGGARERSYRIVKLLLKQQEVFLRTFQEKVFGLGAAELNQPIQAALVMGLSFIVGALIPIIPYLLLTVARALYLSIVLSALTLFVVGVFKRRLAAKSPFLSGVQFFTIAVSAAGLGYLIGLVVQHFLPGATIPA